MDYIKMAVDATIDGMDKRLGGPFGAAIVKDGEVIVVSSNTMMKDTDPSQHAEMVAVRAACQKLGTMDLSGCVCYATCEPCPMCVAILMWAGIREVYYCSTKDDAHRHGFSDQFIRDYLSGSDQTTLKMVRLGYREDCDHLFTYFHALNQ